MLTQLMSQQSDVANPIVPNSSDGKDSVVYSFGPEFRKTLQNSNKEPALARSAMIDFEKRTQNLESPSRNDFFTVDCVSCHTSTQHEDQLVVGPFPGFQRSVWAAEVKLEAMKAGGRFVPVGETTIAIHPWARQKGPGTVLNFGYRFAQPSVSRRVAYEASLSAAMLNKSFLKVAHRAQSCSQSELTTCLDMVTGQSVHVRPTPDLNVLPAAPSADTEASFQACMRIVCEENRVVTRLIAKKDLELVLKEPTVSGTRFVAAPRGAAVYAYVTPGVVTGPATLYVLSSQLDTMRPVLVDVGSRADVSMGDFTIER